MSRAFRRRDLARQTRDAYESLEKLFPSPPDATAEEFDGALLVEELGADLAGGLSRDGMSTAALLAASATAQSLKMTRNLSPRQAAALSHLVDCLESWKRPSRT